MNKQGYINFCKEYEIDPTDYDAVLETVDELEGMFGDKDGKLQQVREYILNNIVDLATKEDTADKSVVGLLEPNIVNVYQMVDSDTAYGKRFMSYKYVKSHGGINMNDYEKVAEVPVEDNVDVNVVLEDAFRYGNTNPEYYANNPKARSISVSDILEYKLVKYYVDSMGFVNLDEDGKLTEDKELLAEKGEGLVKVLRNPEDKNQRVEIHKLPSGKYQTLYYSDEKSYAGVYSRFDDLDSAIKQAQKLRPNYVLEESEDEPKKKKKDDEEMPVEDLPETDVDDIEEETLLDALQSRVGQQMSVAEFNTVLQSLFSRYNDIFILESDIYNADLDETQELIINDDMEDYIINYDIIDVEAGIIEITDVNVE